MARHSKLNLLSMILALAIVAAACGDDETTATDAPETTAAETTAAPATTEAAATTAEATTAATEAPETTVSSEPIKIGALTSLTATFTPWGIHVRDGMQLAVDEINAEGGVNGRPLELIVVDDQSNAEEAVNGIERLIEDGVVAVGGTISSDVGLATARVAEELQTPLFLVKAGSGAILTRDSRYTFRTCLPSAPMVAAPIAQFAQADGLTKVGAIIADYAWGQAVKSALEAEFADLTGIELQVEVAPIGEQDFTTYLRSLEAFDPDLIVATGHPPGAGAITIQSADLGLDVPITGAWTPLSLIMGGGVADAALNRYADFGCADYATDTYQDLAKRYLAASENAFMEDDAVAGYGIVTMIAAAVEAVGDDPVAIAEWLHGQTFDLPGYSFQMGWTEWGELATAQPLFVVIGDEAPPEGVNESGAWYPEELILPSPLEPFEP